MPDLLSIPFLISAVVACIAGMVRGFAGFGAAMLMTPVFSALYGPAVGIALCLLLEIAVALPLLPRVVRLVDWRRIGMLLVAAAIGVPFGNLTLTWADPERLALLRSTGNGNYSHGGCDQRLPERSLGHGRSTDRILLSRRRGSGSARAGQPHDLFRFR